MSGLSKRALSKWKSRGGLSVVLVIAIFWFAGCAPVQKGLGIRFFPPAPQPPKVQFLKRISSSRDIESHSKFESFVVGNIQRKRFIKPYGIEVHDGRIYVCDMTGGTIVVIDPLNQLYDSIHDRGAGDLKRPINLAFDQDGTFYVADIGLHQVMVYDKSYRFRRALGNKEQFKPVDVAVVGDKLYVLDIKDHEIEILDKKTGERLGTIGEPGSDEGQFFKPTNLTVDEKGDLYVSDTVNCRVEKFDPQGNFMTVIGKCGDSVGNFVRPKGVAVDKKGFVYVVDSAFENVQIFSPEGKPALFFGGWGDALVPGALWLPTSVTITYDKNLLSYFDAMRHKDFKTEYLILVTSQFGPAYLNVYAFGEAKEGTPLAKGEVEVFDENSLASESAGPGQ